MNALAQIIVDYPIATSIVGIIVVGRILTRDLSRANKFIDKINAPKSASTLKLLSVVDRRGPNRDKNVIRPAFGQSMFTEESEVFLKTGTGTQKK